jgi:hypothetical protein
VGCSRALVWRHAQSVRNDGFADDYRRLKNAIDVHISHCPSTLTYAVGLTANVDQERVRR